MEVKQISADQTELVGRFVQSMGDSAKGFRYFAKRPLSVIAQHVVTLLALDSAGEPIGYGHLDPEDGKVWLGLCVAEAWRGKGVGKLILTRLLSEAAQRNMAALSLSVDEDNTVAIALYEKFGFVPIEKRGKTCFLHWQAPAVNG